MRWLWLTLVLLATFSLAGCEFIGDVFQFGVGVGVTITVLVLLGLAFFFWKLKG